MVSSDLHYNIFHLRHFLLKYLSGSVLYGVMTREIREVRAGLWREPSRSQMRSSPSGSSKVRPGL